MTNQVGEKRQQANPTVSMVFYFQHNPKITMLLSPVRLSDIPAESSSESSEVSNGKRRKKEKGGSSWHSSNRKGTSSRK